MDAITTNAECGGRTPSGEESCEQEQASVAVTHETAEPSRSGSIAGTVVPAISGNGAGSQPAMTLDSSTSASTPQSSTFDSSSETDASVTITVIDMSSLNSQVTTQYPLTPDSSGFGSGSQGDTPETQQPEYPPWHSDLDSDSSSDADQDTDDSTRNEVARGVGRSAIVDSFRQTTAGSQGPVKTESEGSQASDEHPFGLSPDYSRQEASVYASISSPNLSLGTLSKKGSNQGSQRPPTSKPPPLDLESIKYERRMHRDDSGSDALADGEYSEPLSTATQLFASGRSATDEVDSLLGMPVYHRQPRSDREASWWEYAWATLMAIIATATLSLIWRFVH
ncbi:hypothetical protein F5Y15DRAFT_369312 [Xylariaceae sp. FL0016]|nr:hypothetical protein F5Y15DRAFT_369312 [Xylariaceae sp. FL0016]